MELYEESMPLQVNASDFNLLFVKEENISPLEELAILIKKGENHQKEFFIRKIPSMISVPKVLNQILSQLCPIIEQWDENLQIVLINNTYEVITKIMKEDPINEDNKVLLNTMISHIVRLVVVLDEKVSNEYIFYFDKIIKELSEKQIEININEKLSEFISSLGKFGQDKRNRRFSVYLCSSLIQISSIYSKDIDLLLKRILILFSDSERLVKLQAANELKYLIQILLHREDYKNELITNIETYLRSEEEIIIKCITISSCLYNIQYLDKRILDAIVKSLNEIFSNEIANIDKEILNNVSDMFCTIVNVLRYQSELCNIEAFHKTETIQIFIAKYLYVKEEESINIEIIEKILSHFDDVIYALKIITNEDNFYIRSTIEQLFRLINDDVLISIENSEQIRLLFIQHFDKIVQFLLKSDIEMFFANKDDIKFLLVNCNIFKLSVTLSKMGNCDIFINVIANIILKDNVSFVDMYEENEQNEELINCLKGIRLTIPLIGKKRKIKRRDDIFIYIIDEVKKITDSNRIIKIKQKAIKILSSILKYSTDNYIKDKIIYYCLNEIADTQSFYQRRVLYTFLKETFKLLSSTFINEKNILPKISELISRSKIPIELCNILSILISQNAVLLFDNRKLESAIIEIKQKNIKDIELEKLYEQSIQLIRMKRSNTLLPNEDVFIRDKQKYKEEIDLLNMKTNLFLSCDTIHRNLKLKFRYDVKINPQSKIPKRLGNSTKILPPVMSQSSQVDSSNITSPIQSPILTDSSSKNILTIRREFKSKSYKLKKIDKEKIQIDVKTKNCSKTPNSRPIIKKCILAKDKKTNIKSIERLSITNKRTTPFNSFRFVLK